MPEVIVVGGGVCGLFCSLVLAKLGVDVTVFEEHERIGVPSHCAGHLSIRSLEKLGVYPLPRKIVENEYRGAAFYSSTGRSFEVEFSSPVTCAVNRTLFDNQIAKLAAEAGARIQLGTRVKALIVEKGFAKGVIINRHGKHERETANVVIDAEGISCRILRQAGLRGLDASMVVNGVSAEVDTAADVNEEFVEVYFGAAYAPAFYAWLMPRKDGTAKIGLAAKRENPNKFLEKLMRKHPVASKKLSKAKITRKAFHPITLGGPIPKTFTNGFLAVGDAASQVKPTTGGGVILGMNCARIAAETAYKALCNNDFSETMLSEYERKWRKLFGFDLWVMLQLRKAFEKLSDKQLDKLILECGKLELQKPLRRFRDIDLQGTSLAKLLWHPSILSFGLYLMLQILGSKTFNFENRT